MTRQLMNYIRGAGQILDLSGSYPTQVMDEIREALPPRTDSANALSNDLKRVGKDLRNVLERTHGHLHERQAKRP